MPEDMNITQLLNLMTLLSRLVGQEEDWKKRQPLIETAAYVKDLIWKKSQN